MLRTLPVLALLLCYSGPALAQGRLVSTSAHKTPPLALIGHDAAVTVQDQAAETVVEQVFRNLADRDLAATYVFPVPRGASVRAFALHIDGVKVDARLVVGAEARQLCAHCARVGQDHGLVEYLGNDLLTVAVPAVRPGKDLAVTLRYTALAPRDAGLIEYVYPLKTDGKSTATLERFSLKADLKSRHPIQNVYSPTHAIQVKRTNDREVQVEFGREQAVLDRDFQLFYTLTDKDVGLTAMTHRTVPTDDGHFLFLISPRLEAPQKVVPRDVLLVLDTSGSMKGAKLEQAKKALHHVLKNLNKQDRFALVTFATAVNRYRNDWLDATPDELDKAREWVDGLETTGGTAIDKALTTALEMRTGDPGRTFAVIFFTDGLPSVGETNPATIVKNVERRNSANTRIFTFGVGDDVNATMLDKLAETTRGLATYVRPDEDIATKASALWAKITNPVLTNLKLSAGRDVLLSEVYPPELPDLFQGGELVVLGRYRGQGKAKLVLSGQVGAEKKEFAYDVEFPERTGQEFAFVEHLWARRKVGYLLDQIRANGEQKELVDEAKALAKRHGIATPYTGYLITADGVVPVVNARPAKQPILDQRPLVLAPAGKAPLPLQQFLTDVNLTPENVDKVRAVVLAANLRDGADGKCCCSPDPIKRAQGICSCCKHIDGKCPCAMRRAQGALDKQKAFEDCCAALRKGDLAGVQAGRLGVDLSVECAGLRGQCRVEPAAQRNLLGRDCIEIGGVWVDTGYDCKKTKTVAVKALSDAYFRLLEKQPELKEVFRLGNHLVWVTPSGTALLLDTVAGQEALTDAEIAALFPARK